MATRPFQPLVKKPDGDALLKMCGHTLQIATFGGVITAVSAHVIPLIWTDTRPIWGQFFGVVTVVVSSGPALLFVNDVFLWRHQMKVRIEGRMIRQRVEGRGHIRPSVHVLNKVPGDAATRVDFDSNINVTVWSHLSDYLTNPQNRDSKPSRRPIDAYIKSVTNNEFGMSPRLWKALASELRLAGKLADDQDIKDMTNRQRVEIVRFCNVIVARSTGQPPPALAVVQNTNRSASAVFRTKPNRTTPNHPISAEILASRTWRRLLATIGLVAIVVASAFTFHYLVSGVSAETPAIVERINPESWQCAVFSESGTPCTYQVREGE